MEKKDFLRQTEAPRTVARAAWKAAGGDAQLATSLIKPTRLKVHCKFDLTDEKFGGLVYIEWDFSDNSARIVEGIVSSSKKILNVPLDLPTRNFIDRITWGNKSDLQMSGNTNIFQNSLEKLLEESDSELHTALSNNSIDQFESALKKIIQNSLNVAQPKFSTRIEVVRRIDQERKTEKTLADKGHVFPAEVKINPVKGMPVNQIPIGDLIYVELGDYPKELNKIGRLLQKRRDETGLIPAQLISRQVSDAGTLSLLVRFASDAYGKVRCGKDVKILVPKSTVSKADSMTGTDYLSGRIFRENWPIIFPVVLSLIVIFVLFWFIFI